MAAKLYRSRNHRSFRHDAVYQAGRVILDKRLSRAFTNRSKKGQEVQQTLWIDHEWRTLQRLHAVGADVPRPIARTDNAILMSYYGDPRTRRRACRTSRCRPTRRAPMFERLMRNVELWLANDTIHGDLSSYNVLYWQGQAIAIDFPQAVDPRFNPNAQALLRRDVANLCRYFGRFGVRADPVRIVEYLWGRFLRADL